MDIELPSSLVAQLAEMTRIAPAFVAGPPPSLDELALRREIRANAPFVEAIERLRAEEAAAVVRLRAHLDAVPFFEKSDGRLTPAALANFAGARAASDQIEETRAQIETYRAAARAASACPSA